MRDELLQKMEENYEEFYEEFLEIEKSSNSELHALCPVHGDSNASLHVNIDSGLWHCKTCGVGGGPLEFLSFIFEVDSIDAEDLLEVYLGTKIVPQEPVEKKHKELLNNKKALDALIKLGITRKTIIKHTIGFSDKRYWFPIFDAAGNVRNVRKYEPGNKERKVISISGYGGIKLYPLDNLLKNKIYLFEGEKDTLVAESLGLNSITVTGGASSWSIKLNKYFKEKEVIICYDIDDAGMAGSKKIASFLLEVASSVSILRLPTADMPPTGDFCDYIDVKGFEAFKKLVPEEVKKEDLEDEEIIYDSHLGETTNSFFYNKRIKTKCIVTGKGGLYMCPSKLKFNCKRNQDEKCETCFMKSAGGELTKSLPKDNKIILKLIKVPDDKQELILKQHFRLPLKCHSLRIKVLDVINVEELAVIPEIDYDSISATSYISREVYSIGTKTLEANRPYVLEGRVLPHPITQESTIVNYKSTSTKDHIDMFENSPELHARLQSFQANGWTEMLAKLKEKYHDYEAVTGIFKRHDLFMGIDIVYHSVLNFKFQNKMVKRGHVNALIFGDTRTGKSETADSLISHFRAGEAVGGENLSFAGLVGGVHKVGSGDKWGITWKAIPLNDRRLVKIDEFHEMSYDDIRKMSELMSSGVAVIQKIHNEKTMARTRLLLLANSRSGQNLSYFQFGCQAIPDIMGNKNEDIARLDFALAVKSTDVDLEEINKLKGEKREIQTFTSDLCNSLVMWAWSRKPNQIVFTPEAEALILRESIRQSKEYHMSIPLVPTAEHPIKVARISAAVASMFYSTDDGEKVIIKEEHAKFAVRYLDKIYCSEAMSFNIYSKQKMVKDEIKDVKELENLGITDTTRDLLLQFDKISASNLEAIFNKGDNQSGKFLLHYLLKNNAIQPEKHYFIKTPAFIRWLMKTDFSKAKSSISAFK